MCDMIAPVALTGRPIPSSRKIPSFFGLLMRATVRATLNMWVATWQATRLSSSPPVTASSRSARAAPAFSCTVASQPSPRMVISPKASVISATFAGFRSITSTSWLASTSSFAK